MTENTDRVGQAIVARLLEESSRAFSKRVSRIQQLEGLASQVLNGPIQIGPDLIELEMLWDGDKPVLVNRRDGSVIDAGPGESLPVRMAVMLHMAAMPSNHFVGEVCQVEEAKHGAPYQNLSGALYQFPCRFSEDYMASQRARNRVRARWAMKRAEASLPFNERLAMKKGWWWRKTWKFTTLTLPGVSFRETHTAMLLRLYRAWTLLRKRQWWVESVDGAVKGTELANTTRGWHPHIHIMTLGGMIDPMKLRQEWTECVKKATLEAYNEIPDMEPVRAVPGSSTKVLGGAMTDVRMIRAKGPAQGDDEIALDDALTETLKYVTSSEDLQGLSSTDLLEGMLTEHWPRMFELTGLCRKKAKPREAEIPAGDPLLDTSCVSDGATGTRDGQPEDAGSEKPKAIRPPSWRKLMMELDLGDFIAVMFKRVTSAQRFRAKQLAAKYEGAFCTLDGIPLMASGLFSVV